MFQCSIGDFHGDAVQPELIWATKFKRRAYVPELSELHGNAVHTHPLNARDPSYKLTSSRIRVPCAISVPFSEHLGNTGYPQKIWSKVSAVWAQSGFPQQSSKTTWFWCIPTAKRWNCALSERSVKGSLPFLQSCPKVKFAVFSYFSLTKSVLFSVYICNFKKLLW